jgi:hypothetical protein
LAMDIWRGGVGFTLRSPVHLWRGGAGWGSAPAGDLTWLDAYGAGPSPSRPPCPAQAPYAVPERRAREWTERSGQWEPGHRFRHVGCTTCVGAADAGEGGRGGAVGGLHIDGPNAHEKGRRMYISRAIGAAHLKRCKRACGRRAWYDPAAFGRRKPPDATAWMQGTRASLPAPTALSSRVVLFLSPDSVFYSRYRPGHPSPGVAFVFAGSLPALCPSHPRGCTPESGRPAAPPQTAGASTERSPLSHGCAVTVKRAGDSSLAGLGRLRPS